jgi:hypothetical protein
MKESAIEEHARIGNDYEWWKITAHELFASSAILNRERERVETPFKAGPRPAPMESRTFWVELMLDAFGIECLIKAIWLKQGHQLARDGRYIGMMPKEGHRLEKLCVRAGIALNRREEETLTRLSDIAGSAGRYPIPSRVPQRPVTIRWSDPGDYEIIENLIARLERELEKMV